MKSLPLFIVSFFAYISCLSQPAPPPAAPPATNNNDAVLHKIFKKKNDVDFEFSLANRSPTSFKYYLRNDSLWVSGTNLYATVVPLNSVDFGRTIYFLESSLWKTRTNDKCTEVGLHAIKGKKFGQEFEVPEFKSHFEDKEIDFVNLILPNRAFAEELIKYLKARRP